MNMSRRGLRKIRRAKKMGTVTSINLVSMIDIFTILIIYLLVNTAAVQINGADQVDLPTSQAEEPPRQNVAIIVTKDDILVDGKAVMKVIDIDMGPKGPDVIEPLKQYLLQNAPPTPSQQAEGSDGGEVNILADKSIEYALLKRIMWTCSAAQFAKLSFGVMPKGSGVKKP